jgi:protocatechuate 3,4-dioxygenase beta subunit
MSRRRMFGVFAKTAAGLVLAPAVLSACDSGGSGDDTGDDSSGDPDAGGGGSCSEIPEETAGPYPGDGTNGPNALTLSGIEREDIRTSIGSASGTAEGVEFTVTLTLVDSSSCEPLVGHAIYLWHCNRSGNYSMYTGDAVDENYLRGVQVTDDAGQVSFTTIFPACYSGRWPHIHFEVYGSLAEATTGNAKIAVSQLALPKSTCDQVYATSGYEDSVTNLAQISLSTDNVFSDGSSLQLASISGAVSGDLAATLTVAIAG